LPVKSKQQGRKAFHHRDRGEKQDMAKAKGKNPLTTGDTCLCLPVPLSRQTGAVRPHRQAEKGRRGQRQISLQRPPSRVNRDATVVEIRVHSRHSRRFLGPLPGSCFLHALHGECLSPLIFFAPSASLCERQVLVLILPFPLCLDLSDLILSILSEGFWKTICFSCRILRSSGRRTAGWL